MLFHRAACHQNNTTLHAYCHWSIVIPDQAIDRNDNLSPFVSCGFTTPFNGLSSHNSDSGRQLCTFSNEVLKNIVIRLCDCLLYRENRQEIASGDVRISVVNETNFHHGETFTWINIDRHEDSRRGNFFYLSCTTSYHLTWHRKENVALSSTRRQQYVEDFIQRRERGISAYRSISLSEKFFRISVQQMFIVHSMGTRRNLHIQTLSLNVHSVLQK